MLIDHDLSSLVIDTLCKQAAKTLRLRASTSTSHKEEQSLAEIPGSLLKQVAGGRNEVPQAIIKAFRDRRRVIGRQRLVLADIVEFLQDIISQRTFVCVDALDECPASSWIHSTKSSRIPQAREYF